MDDKVKERRARKLALRLVEIRRIPREEWLTTEIANEYTQRAKKLSNGSSEDTGDRRRLRQELQERCGITEIEAINILQGMHVQTYISKYEMASTQTLLKSDLDKIEGDIELVRKFIYDIETGQDMGMPLVDDYDYLLDEESQE